MKDLTIFLWLLKLGTVYNLYLLWSTLQSPLSYADVGLLIPAQILLGVSAFRCAFPVIYKDNVVFHDNMLSSIFLTRTLATFSEVAYIYQFAYVLRLLNTGRFYWIDCLTWVMVLQVSLSQCFVWTCILTKRLQYFFYEEAGWLLIFAINTLVSVYLRLAGSDHFLLNCNLVFGALYLPWQCIHLRVLFADAQANAKLKPLPWQEGLSRSLWQRNSRRDAASWGSWVGLSWIVGYWATIIPMWVHYMVVSFS